MMDAVLDAYDLEESIRREGGPRLIMLPFIRKAIEMMLQDDKDRAMDYLKLARQAERLYQEVPDWYEAVMTSRFGPQPFHGLLNNDEDEDDRDIRDYCHEETFNEECGLVRNEQDIQGCGCEERHDEEHGLDKRHGYVHSDHEEAFTEEQGFEERDRDQHAYGHYEDRCKLDKGETCDEERDLKGRDYDCHREDHCKCKRRERGIEEGCDREETWNEEHTFEGKDQHSQGCNREETCDEEQAFKGKDQDTHVCGHEETCDKEYGMEWKDQDTQGWNPEERCDEERGLKREDREGCDNEETWNEEHAFDGKDQNTQGCSHEETCDKERGLEKKDQDLHGYNQEKDHYKLTKSAQDLQGYDRYKDYCKHKRKNQCRALHGCANEKALDGSHDGEKGWDRNSHGLNFDDKYDRFNKSHKQEKKLEKDENLTFKCDNGDDRNETHDLGLDDSKGECIIDGESECHEKNEGYDDRKLCTFCGYGYDRGNDEGESDKEESCVLGCLGFLRDRFYKSFSRSNGDIHKDIHFKNRIGICGDEDVLQKYVHVGLHNDHKGKENLENVIWDEYHDDVKSKFDNIEDNLQNVRMVWDVYNDNVGIVSVCGKDEFWVDDIECDGYLVINDLVIKDILNSKDDDDVSIINIEVGIEEDDIVLKWMIITYKEERKEVIVSTTYGKEGKDASRWWDVQLNRGGCIGNISISHLKEKDWLIRRSTRFLDLVRQDTSTALQEDQRRRSGIGLQTILATNTRQQ